MADVPALAITHWHGVFCIPTVLKKCCIPFLTTLEPITCIKTKNYVQENTNRTRQYRPYDQAAAHHTSKTHQSLTSPSH